MNSSSPDFNVSSSSSSLFTESHNLSSLSASPSLSSTLSPSLSTSISLSPLPFEPHDPGLTIMVVLGLSLLFAVCAAFLAVCRPSTSAQNGGSAGGCGAGEALACGPSLSSEPQLMLWKRLGSYRRSYSCSFRRPPQRRPDRDHDHDHDLDLAIAQVSPARQQPGHRSPREPHLITTPCLFDYVTEI